MNGPNNPIRWTDYTWNPIKGLCPVGCPYCYARRIYKRFKYDPTIRLDKKELYAPLKLKKPAKIFVCSTMELFGEWMEDILSVAFHSTQHTFQFLTKFPERTEEFFFSENCWCGVTIEDDKHYNRTLSLQGIDAPIRFISFEPLHSAIPFNSSDFGWVDWVIIGAETGNRKGKITPKEEWILSIVLQADKLKVPVFMKDNLKPYWKGELRQESPKAITEGLKCVVD